ncbi:Dut dUTPase [uncultured Caudovirales phage]|uniref:dUTP diphosphatase n=1 Tax=uncultured Caudovirales phage TaxID=2100421 RepID=A0A6J7WTU6_9CAUD|nr:Dut dUTPase [uncultured Caudovirales phage]
MNFYEVFVESVKNVKVKRTNPLAVIPQYAKPGDAGMDLVAISATFDKTSNFVEFDTGLAFEIPEGYVGFVFPRSSISNYSMRLANSVGVIDSGYRGSVRLRFRLEGDKPYQVGDKIGQIMIMPFPEVKLVEVSELSESQRLESGFGSSGR